jgi:hypothetical protein
LEAVGNTDVYFYKNSDKYLAAGGIFISTGPYPQSLAGFGQLLHLGFEIMRPRFLGGAKGKWRRATSSPNLRSSLISHQPRLKYAF